MHYKSLYSFCLWEVVTDDKSIIGVSDMLFYVDVPEEIIFNKLRILIGGH